MRNITAVDHLSDRDLLSAAERVAADERHVTAELLALLGELDARRLYLGQSCASLFTYCTQALHLSEHAAYHRIEAARAARQFPVILDMVAGGALTLTTVTLLRPHLTRQNHVALLEAARHKSKREVEQQIAGLAPKPDERTIVRKLVTPVATAPSAPAQVPHITPSRDVTLQARAILEPLSAERYLLKVTLSAEAHAKLRRAQDLIRHTIPNGDPALDAVGRRSGADQDREDRTLGTLRGVRPTPIATAPISVAPCSGIDSPHRVGTRRGTLRLHRRARPMHRNRPPRVPSHRSIRRRRQDEHRQPRVALPGAQCA